MAFSSSWVESDPDGAVITGSQLDDYIRATKAQIRERLEGDPANVNSGIFDSGSFGTAATVRMGTGRIYATTAANLSSLTKQDGRMAYVTDTGQLYHLGSAGVVEIGYLRSVITSQQVTMKCAPGSENNAMLASANTSDTQSRFFLTYNGSMYWGVGGSTSTDVSMYRNGVGLLGITGNLSLTGTLYASGTYGLAIGNYGAVPKILYGQVGTYTFSFLKADGTYASIYCLDATVSGNASISGTLNVTGQSTLSSVTSSGGIQTTGYLASGTNTAATGALRLAQGGTINSRNAGNTADVIMLFLDASNQINLGTGNTVIMAGSASVGSNLTVTGNVTAAGFFTSSKESMKENIVDFTDNATAILRGTAVKRFNYKADPTQMLRIGFIADYTHEFLSTTQHDRFDQPNTIGVLLKAFQEIDARVTNAGF